MLLFETDNGKIFYDRHLDGGGTTFGINCLKDPKVSQHIKKGKILEICSGPGFMGFYLNFNNFASELILSDINFENKKYIEETIKLNKINNTTFICSKGFDSIPKDMKFDTIISNPPHFSTRRPNGYIDSYQELLSLDLDMEFHKNFIENVNQYLEVDGKIIFVENSGGITYDNIREICSEKFKVELLSNDKYGWNNESEFYTVLIKK